MQADNEGLSRDEVHQALEVLYDNVALAASPLLRRFPRLAEIARVDERAEKARALLLEAVEVLRPARSVPFGSLESRGYEILSLRYVENLSLPQVGRELSLSRRQVYRDLAEAEEKLVQVLATWALVNPPDVGGAKSDHLSDELTALASQPIPVEVQPLIEEAMDLVAPLATGMNVTLERDATVTDQGPLVLADRAILKQIMVQILSGAIQSALEGEIRLAVSTEADACTLAVRFRPVLGYLQRDMFGDARRVAASQGIACELKELESGDFEVHIRLRRGEAASVLIVEDNPSAVELYRRFLAGGNWHVNSVSDPRLAFEVARRFRPDVIMLDIIMPGVDGWSIIKALRQHEATQSVPLIICSVLEDPQLAEALGASVYLTKPVSRAELIAALNSCLRPRPPANRDG